METYPALFNVRIYGILMHKNQVLLSDEIHNSQLITKFPGGGLQFGEGTLDALKREFREELDIEIEIENHFYTTDFFQPSAFNPKQQVISIYYTITSPASDQIKTAIAKNDFPEIVNGLQNFRWKDLTELSPVDFTFPIDQHVAKLLSAK